MTEPSRGAPLVVAYGLGRDSTALLIEMHRRRIRPDLILFADVGAEKEGTYRFKPIFNRWLLDHGFPPITTVKYEPKRAPYHTIAGNSVKNATLPSAAFGRGACTDKFKIQPQNRYVARWTPALSAWARGGQVIKYLGFEAGEEYRRQKADFKAHAGKLRADDRVKYRYEMPLIDWGYDLERCITIIEQAGLPVPPKSACVMCPNQKPEEVHELSPEELGLVILQEVVAEPMNTTLHGLWRRPRKSDGRPGSITEYALERGLKFTPLTAFGRRIVLNPRCQKARQGYTLKPPHRPISLRRRLEARGHAVPEVVTDGKYDVDRDAEFVDMHISRRIERLRGKREHERHMEMVDDLLINR